MTQIDFFAQLPNWQPNSPIDQLDFISKLKVLLNQMDDEVNDSSVRTVTLTQSARPTQSDWETAWTGAGYTLPIPSTARLLWYDTVRGAPGGYFGTLNNDTTVYERASVNNPGAINRIESAYLVSNHTIDYIIGGSLTMHPSVTFTTNVPTILYMQYIINTTLGAGSGSWGADFLLNGVKVGSTYYSRASNRGIIERTTTGLIVCEAITPVLEPDDYEVQAIAGRTNGTTPTLTVNDNVRQLIVKAIAQ